MCDKPSLNCMAMNMQNTIQLCTDKPVTTRFASIRNCMMDKINQVYILAYYYYLESCSAETIVA